MAYPRSRVERARTRGRRGDLALRVACGLGCLVGSGWAYGADFYVRSAAEITAALALAAPGDTLTMANGTWTNQDISFAKDGTAAAPITLRAETPGRVILTGASKLSISGRHLEVSGLTFRDGALGSGEHVVRFNGSRGVASNSRLTNCAFVDFNPASAATRYFWVSMYGQDNRVDHNFFRGQNHSGVTLVVWPTAGQPARHLIDSNQFADRPVGTGNGFETIRIGTSEVQATSTQVVVEGNLFERTDGETETISNKTSNNTFRRNTFRDVQGTLTLRHGRGSTVDGNFFLGRGDSQSGAIRVIGPDHVIVNNFIADVGTRSNGAIALTTGDSDFNVAGPNSNGYEPVTNVQVVHNTVYQSREATIRLDDLFGSGATQTVRPSNVRVANNLLHTTLTSTIKGTVGSTFTWSGNVAFGSSLGISPRVGITQADPQMSPNGIELYRPGHNSPVANAATTGAWVLPALDMDGQTRTTPADIGADELGYTQIAAGPLWAADVGPSWLKRRGYDAERFNLPVIYFRATDYTAISDPDGNWQTWGAAAGGMTGSVLKAPTGARTDLPGTQDAVVEYDLAFHDAGTYFLSALVRGFDPSSDSLYVPATLGGDPTVSVSLVPDGNWYWLELGSYTVSSVGLNRPVTLRLGKRERDVEIDAVMLSTFRRSFVVPEPGAGALMLVPLVMLSGRRRRDGHL